MKTKLDYTLVDKPEIIDEMGEPIAVIIETPYEWIFDNDSETVPFKAEDYFFDKPNGFLHKKIGGFGTDYHYFGIWKNQ